MQKIYFLCFFSLVLYSVSAQTVGELYRQSIQTYEKGDYANFLDQNIRLLEMRPNNPSITYNLAVAYALTDQPDKALHYLRLFISNNAETPFEEDGDFSKIAALPDFLALMNYANDLQKEKQSSELFLKVALEGFHTEDIAIDKRKKLYLTDVYQGKVLQYVPKKEKSTILVELPISAMAVETGKKNNQVWVSGSMMPQFHLYDSTQHFVAALYLINTKRNQIIHTIAVPGQHVFGSMCRTAKTDIYISDSHEPIIYHLDEKSRTIKEWLRLDDAMNLQGISYDATTQSLWVADYLKGIARISLVDKSYYWLSVKDYSLRGIDGLAYTEKGLIGVQNGTTPKRLVQFQVDGPKITEVEILDNHLPYGGEPTNGYISPQGFVYIVNSPWPFYTKDNKPMLEQWEKLVLRLLRF